MLEKLSFKLVDRVTQPSKTVNEDLFEYNSQAAWVFDGASGIGPGVIPGAPTDPFWLVHRMNEAIKTAWRDEMPTSDIFRTAISDVICQYQQRVEEPLPSMTDRPTACLLMARLSQGKLELSTVGDCWAVYSNNADIHDFGHKIGPASIPVYEELARLKAAGVMGKDLEQRLLPVERAFRAKANIEGGYTIMDLTERWIKLIQQKSFDVSSGDKLLLMTDGFYRLIDTFKTYDATSLLGVAQEDGLQALLDELRTMENGDKNCVAFPRVKIHDDVAAGLLFIN